MTAPTHLLRAVRALVGLDPAALDAVTPDAMRAVMLARGWRFDRAEPWHGDPALRACEVWEHDRARGIAPGRPWPATVRVVVLGGVDASETRRHVVTWAEAVATRHGDAAPAEVLAEALAWGAA